VFFGREGGMASAVGRGCPRRWRARVALPFAATVGARRRRGVRRKPLIEMPELR